MVCGELRVEGAVNVREVELPGRLGRRLWVYLVLSRRRRVGREELYEALWGDDAPDAADASLNALVSRLRTAVASAGAIEIRATGGSYSLALPDGTFVDRERAWEAINHVNTLRRGGDVRAAWSEAIIANELAARGLLPGEDAPWIAAERRTLRDTELQALEAICDAELAQGRPEEAERVARRLISRDELRESGYRYLMRALESAGNGAQAANIMDECRSALAAVGAHPSAETERVFRSTRGG
jgi:DNA-binding SARP family transcriptional activator